MAGHSKFKNIQFRKGAQDKRRSTLFSRLTREITVAARTGMPQPENNPRLRTAVQAARAHNMPKESIARAIKKSTDPATGMYEEVRYEGFAPGGVGVIVETLTGNRNRTAGDIRTIFSRHGGSLGETGAVSFMFERVGEIVWAAAAASPDAMLEAAIEAGADDCESGDDAHEVTCAASVLHRVAQEMGGKFGAPLSAGLVWKPQTLVEVSGDVPEKLFKLLELLDENDDVQSVAANFDVPQAVLDRITAA